MWSFVFSVYRPKARVVREQDLLLRLGIPGIPITVWREPRVAMPLSWPGRSAARSFSRRGALQSRGPGYHGMGGSWVPVLRSIASRELRAASRPGQELSKQRRHLPDLDRSEKHRAVD